MDQNKPAAPPRAQSHSKAQREHHRRAARKEENQAQRADAQAQPDDPSAKPADDQQPRQFLAILGDVLPQDAPPPAAADTRNADASAEQDLASTFQPPSQLPSQLPLQSVLGQALPVAAAAAVPDAKSTDPAEKFPDLAAGKVAAAAAQHVRPGALELSAPPDPRLEITREAIPSHRTALAQKHAETGELAFAARIAQQPGARAALNFNDASSAIAASRFESAGSKGFAGSRDHASPNPAATPGNTQANVADPAASDRPSQVLADSQLSSEPAERPAAAAQTAGTPSGAAVASGRAATESASSQAGLPPVTAASAATAEGRGASGGKPAAESRAPQFLEPAETSARNGESVKDISLRLSLKDQNSVQVRLSERAGELRVSVRTPDDGLTRGLRDGLSELVGRLEHNGYKAETWQPADKSSTAQDQGRPSQDQPSRQQQGGSGSGSGQQQNARDHQQPDAQTPQWVGELESSLRKSDSPWQPAQ